ncbi:MAG: DUF1566 domain-containing protein [Bacteroidales bacterium]|jgi:hypothetical protein|nr:DUF1566 domain-containing protein [Bacteroidales bacterium]
MKYCITAALLFLVAGLACGQDDSKDVITLAGYLVVHPEDLGEFSVAPTKTISALNAQAVYGYGNWRLPTQEELDLMCSNREKLNMLNGASCSSCYATKETLDFGKPSNEDCPRYYVRLVTTGKKKK